MKIVVGLIAALGAVAAVAQSTGHDAGAGARRAPLADVDAVEPAVNVGERQLAVAAERIAAAPASPAAKTPEAARSSAASSTRVSPSAAAPAAAPQPPVQRAMDTLDLGTTSITGNQELPKVLYIVPWKKSDLGDLVGRPVNTLLDEVLTPIDPDVFERHLKYYDSLHRQGRKE